MKGDEVNIFLDRVPHDSCFRHIAEEAVNHISIIPEHMRGGVLRWVFYGVAGDFLKAVVSNDLFKACGKADRINASELHQYATYFYNYAPRDCFCWRGAGHMEDCVARKFKVVAVLPDGQRFDDEAHVGEYHKGGMTRHEAEEARDNLDIERPMGHEDVDYEVEEEK